MQPLNRTLTFHINSTRRFMSREVSAVTGNGSNHGYQRENFTFPRCVRSVLTALKLKLVQNRRKKTIAKLFPCYKHCTPMEHFQMFAKLCSTVNLCSNSEVTSCDLMIILNCQLFLFISRQM